MTNLIRVAAEMALEYQAQREQAAKEAEEELARKAELIKQIRLLERNIPGIGKISKNIDLTETSGCGILGEMSIVEVSTNAFIDKFNLCSCKNDWRLSR
jgi:hypothetical protein